MYRKLLVAVALLAPGAAHADWHEASSDHFVVYADDSAENVADFTTRLERFDKAIRVMREVPSQPRGPSSRVTVFMVGSVDEVQRLHGGSGNVAGFYIPRPTGSTAFVPNGSAGSGSISAQRILMHEYAHHFMFNDWPSAIFPQWFVEGFAEFNSTAAFARDGSVTFGGKPDDRGYGVTMGNQLPINYLLRVFPGKLSPIETYVLYSRGWLLTHYLTFDPERRKQLAEYIVAINEGKSSEEAAKAFGSLSALELRLNNYAKSRSFPAVRFSSDMLPIGKVVVRKLGQGEAATMPARIRSTAGVDEKKAQQVVVQARALAAPFPQDAAAQNVLAEAEYDAKNYAAADAAAARALAADPKSVHAALYRGMAQEAILTAAKSTDAAGWTAVRKWYLAANKIDPEAPEPLIRYYSSFESAKQKPTKNAEDGLLYAAALAPYALDVRMTAAGVYLRRGDGAKARAAMMPVAVNERAGPYAERIRKVLDTLDKSGATAASAEFDRGEAEAKKKAEDAKATKSEG